MGETKIEWAEKVWNAVTGCTKVSDGCRNCYAERMAKRLAAMPKTTNKYSGTVSEKGWTGAIQLDHFALDEPLRWKKPARIFVCSMGDLFHKDVPFDFILKVFDRIEQAKQHTFIVLTKRPERVLEFCATYGIGTVNKWPKNIIFMVSVEDQDSADKRIPIALQVPSEIHGVSYEPALGPVDFTNIAVPSSFIEERHERLHNFVESFKFNSLTTIDENHYYNAPSKLDWVILGGESGPGARPMHPDWARSVRDQCQAAGVPFFFKQWGEWAPTMNVEYLNTATRQIEVHETALKDGFPYKSIVLNNKRIPVKDGMFRVGKKAAGCLLDGKEHKERP